jgi:hypothetical protein
MNLKKHAADIQEADAGPCPYEHRTFLHHSRLNSHLLIHLINDHGPQNTHLVVSQDIGVQVS